MSSFLRTLQKRILRRSGFMRQTKRVEIRVEIRNGVPTIINLKKGTGPIIGPDGHEIGRNYPMFLPRPDVA